MRSFNGLHEIRVWEVLARNLDGMMDRSITDPLIWLWDSRRQWRRPSSPRIELQPARDC